MKLRRVIPVVLAAVMAVSLVGCGKKNDNTRKIDKDTIYKENPIEVNLPENLNVSTMNVVGDKAYFCGYSYDDVTYESKNMWGYFTFGQPDVKTFTVGGGNSWLDKMVVSANGEDVYLFYSDWTSSYESGSVGSATNLPKPVEMADLDDDDDEDYDDEDYDEDDYDDDIDDDDLIYFGFGDDDSDDDGLDIVSDPLKGGVTDSGSFDITDSVIDIDDDYYDDDYYEDDYQSFYYMAKYNLEGKEVKKIDLSEEYDISYSGNLYMLSDGKILMLYDTEIYLFDENCDLVKQNSAEEYIDTLYLLKNGTAICTFWGEDGQKTKYFDLDKLEMGEDVNLPISLMNYNIKPGEGYDLYLMDQVAVYGYNIGDAEPKELFNFVNSDLSVSYFECFAPVDANTFIGTYYDYEDDYKYLVCKYTKVPADQVVDKTILTLGCTYLDNEVRKEVIKFNKSNDKYRITIKDYSSYSTEEDWDGSTKAFNNDIASGNAPDIVISDDTALIHNYISKGLFEDLTPYIEKDPDIDINDIFPNLREACSYNGKMYEIVPRFFIETLAGKQKNLGNRKSWNMKEMLEYGNTLKEGQSLFAPDTSRDMQLYEFMYINGANYVDEAKGECYFDTDDFKALLEYLKTLPAETDDFYELFNEDESFWQDYENLWIEDRVMLQGIQINDFRGFNSLEKCTFGDKVSLVGYPTDNGCGAAIYYWFSVGISSKCSSTDAAWEFVRKYLTKDYFATPESYGIPALMSEWTKMGEEAKERPYYMDGDQKVYYDDTYYRNGEWVPIDCIDDDGIARLTEYVKSVNKVRTDLSDIEDIIIEEAAPFFEGQKSVDEVAKIIQSRASIYIKEKR